MKTPPPSSARRLTWLAGLTFTLGVHLHAQLAPAPAAPPAATHATTPATATPAAGGTTAEEALVLSPFLVDAGAEKGYLATQSLSGTRFRSDLRDIGSSVTVFTEQMLQDLGANSLLDIVAFSPNADVFVVATDDVTGNGNTAINDTNRIVLRGGATSVVSQDFFASNVPNDRFSSEGLTFSRGPNAILFGLGNSAGAFLSSTKRAKPKRATSFAHQLDDRGSYRVTLDHNQPLIPKLLAVRVAALYENSDHFRPPTESVQRRQFATVSLTPFAQTTLRFNYERGDVVVPALRPWPAYDAYTPWVNAGRPIVPTYVNVAGGKPVGTENFTHAGLVSTALSPAGTQVPTMRWINSAQSAPPRLANGEYTSGLPVVGVNFRSLLDPAVYPTFVSNHGNTSFQHHDYERQSLFLEQRVTENFFVELALNRSANDITRFNGLVGQSDYIFVDPNGQLPSGAPNPNVGRLYTQGQSTRIDNPGEAKNLRVTASYDLNLTRRTGWRRHLGRHQAALFVERSKETNWNSNNNLFNLTPLNPALPLSNGQNLFQLRYYLDPSQGQVGTQAGRYFRSLPTLYAGDPVPPRDPSGVTPGFFAQQGLSARETHLETRALAVQSFFWDRRIVLTNGWRTDDQTNWSIVPADIGALRDPVHGAGPRGDRIDVRAFKPDSRTERGGSTYTRGLVFHALPWLSLSYNTSNNFQVNSGARNLYGDLLPNPRGEGRDYGIRVALLENRLFFDVTHYENSTVDAPDFAQSTPAGNYGFYDQMWTSIANFTGDNKYRSFPYANIGSVEQDIIDTESTGWEASLTANLTPEWRFTVNGYRKTEASTTDRGTYTFPYFEQFMLPLVKSVPAWQNLDVQGETLAERVVELEGILQGLRGLKSVPSGNFSSKWGINFITSYDLKKIAALKGVTVGLNMNLRGKAVNGYAVDARGGLDPTRPYYAPAYAVFGSMLSYQRRIWQNRIGWRLQLNVRNLFDTDTIFPLRAVDRLDGTGRPAVAVYTLREPRTFQLTNTFSF